MTEKPIPAVASASDTVRAAASHGARRAARRRRGRRGVHGRRDADADLVRPNASSTAYDVANHARMTPVFVYMAAPPTSCGPWHRGRHQRGASGSRGSHRRVRTGRGVAETVDSSRTTSCRSHDGVTGQPARSSTVEYPCRPRPPPPALLSDHDRLRSQPETTLRSRHGRSSSRPPRSRSRPGRRPARCSPGGFKRRRPAGVCFRQRPCVPSWLVISATTSAFASALGTLHSFASRAERRALRGHRELGARRPLGHRAVVRQLGPGEVVETGFVLGTAP
jgi:hypothetical protein